MPDAQSPEDTVSGSILEAITENAKASAFAAARGRDAPSAGAFAVAVKDLTDALNTLRAPAAVEHAEVWPAVIENRTAPWAERARTFLGGR